MRVLLTAPYVGEIGWELMSWQARVRFLFELGRFDRLVVLGAPGRSAFYADMPMEYREVDLSPLPGAPCEDRRALPPSHELLPAEAIRSALEPTVRRVAAELGDRGAETHVLWPDYAGTIYPCEHSHQTFIRFERPCRDPRPTPWVVLVRRNRSFGAANWPPDLWATLGQLLEARGVHTSFYPRGSEAAIAAASHCDLAVGQSTGQLHPALRQAGRRRPAPVRQGFGGRGVRPGRQPG